MPLDNANGSRSFGLGFWGLLVGGGPWGSPCHWEHHLVPSLPWYQQLILHRHVVSRADADAAAAVPDHAGDRLSPAVVADRATHARPWRPRTGSGPPGHDASGRLPRPRPVRARPRRRPAGAGRRRDDRHVRRWRGRGASARCRVASRRGALGRAVGHGRRSPRCGATPGRHRHGTVGRGASGGIALDGTGHAARARRDDDRHDPGGGPRPVRRQRPRRGVAPARGPSAPSRAPATRGGAAPERGLRRGRRRLARRDRRGAGSPCRSMAARCCSGRATPGMPSTCS